MPYRQRWKGMDPMPYRRRRKGTGAMPYRRRQKITCVVYIHNAHVCCVYRQHKCVLCIYTTHMCDVHIHNTHVCCVDTQHTCVLCIQTKERDKMSCFVQDDGLCRPLSTNRLDRITACAGHYPTCTTPAATSHYPAELVI